MNVDSSAILALISELYATVTRQAKRIVELEKDLAIAKDLPTDA